MFESLSPTPSRPRPVIPPAPMQLTGVSGIAIQYLDALGGRCYGQILVAKGAPGYGVTPNDTRVVHASPSGGYYGEPSDAWAIVYRLGTDDNLAEIAHAFADLHKPTSWLELFRSPVVFYALLVFAISLDFFREVPTWLLVIDGVLIAVLSTALALCLIPGKGRDQQ